MLIDLYTAIKLCDNEEYIRINEEEFTIRDIINKYDLRKTKVKKIYFDRWHGALTFETQTRRLKNDL